MLLHNFLLSKYILALLTSISSVKTPTSTKTTSVENYMNRILLEYHHHPFVYHHKLKVSNISTVTDPLKTNTFFTDDTSIQNLSLWHLTCWNWFSNRLTNLSYICGTIFVPRDPMSWETQTVFWALKYLEWPRSTILYLINQTHLK